MRKSLYDSRGEGISEIPKVKGKHMILGWDLQEMLYKAEMWLTR